MNREQILNQAQQERDDEFRSKKTHDAVVKGFVASSAMVLIFMTIAIFKDHSTSPYLGIVFCNTTITGLLQYKSDKNKLNLLQALFGLIVVVCSLYAYITL